MTSFLRGFLRRSDRPASHKTEGEEVTPDYSVLFADIRHEWDEAELVIKLAEQVTYDAIIPAVTELRYAGRRLIDALNAAAEGVPADRITAFLEDARFNCHRARHDAVDAAFAKMAIDLNRLAYKMGYDTVVAAYPDFVRLVRQLDEARDKILESRRYRANRDEIYKAISEVDFPSLVQDYRLLRQSETTMRIIKAAKSTSVGIGIVLAVIGYILAAYMWLYPRPAPAVPRPPVAQKAETQKLHTNR